MLFKYPAIIHNENDGLWLEFVDFNCYTYADTLNELLYNAKEAMECQRGYGMPYSRFVRMW